MDCVARPSGEVIDFTGWLPIRLFVKDGTAWVDWCYRGTTPLRAAFFQDDVQQLLRSPFNLAFRRYTPISDLVTWAEKTSRHTRHAPLKAFIAHASRCGSTLVAQMLAHQPTHVVMSEPPMLDTLLGIRAQLPDVTHEQHVRWLRALVFALGQAPVNETHLVIKLDAWHVLQHDLLSSAFPGLPWIFIYRNPVEIAVSQLNQRASYMVPGMVAAMTQQIPVAEALLMSQEAYIAHVLGRIFSAGAAACERSGVRPVDYATLPGVLVDELLPLLGLGSDDATVAALRATATRDAKSPTMGFSSDSARKQQSATEQLRAVVSAHCQDSYNRLLKLSRR